MSVDFDVLNLSAMFALFSRPGIMVAGLSLILFGGAALVHELRSNILLRIQIERLRYDVDRLQSQVRTLKFRFEKLERDPGAEAPRPVVLADGEPAAASRPAPEGPQATRRAA